MSGLNSSPVTEKNFTFARVTCQSEVPLGSALHFSFSQGVAAIPARGAWGPGAQRTIRRAHKRRNDDAQPDCHALAMPHRAVSFFLRDNVKK